MLPATSSLHRQLLARVHATPWRVVLPWLLAASIVVWFGFKALSAAWHFTIDDSGISFAYAKHIAQGDGVVAAVGGPRVEGYSNALWVFLLVPFCWLGLPLPLVSKVLGVLCLLGALWAGIHLLLRTQPKRPLGPLLALFWCLSMVVTLEVAVWTVAGLENALLGLLLLGMVYFDVREHDEHERFPVSSVLGFLLCITRPEGPAYALPMLALKGLFALREARLRPQFKRAVVWFAAPLSLYHLVHFAVFREFVPNTYFAKPQSKSLDDGIKYLRTNLRDSRLLYVLPLVLIGIWCQWRSKVLLVWITIFGCMFVLYSGGDWMPHARFISFFAPAMLLLAAFGARNLTVCITILTRKLGTSVAQRWSKNPTTVAHWVSAACLLFTTVALGWAWQNVQLARLQKVKQGKFCHFCAKPDAGCAEKRH